MAPLRGQEENWPKVKHQPRTLASLPLSEAPVLRLGAGMGEKAGPPPCPRPPACASVLPPPLLWQNNAPPPFPRWALLDHPTALPGGGPVQGPSCPARLPEGSQRCSSGTDKPLFQTEVWGWGGRKRVYNDFFFFLPPLTVCRKPLCFYFCSFEWL